MRYHEALELYLSDKEVNERVVNGFKRINPYLNIFVDEHHFTLENGPHFSPRWIVRLPSEDLIKRSIQIGSAFNDGRDVFTGLVIYAHNNTHMLEEPIMTCIKPQIELDEEPELIIPELNSALIRAADISAKDLTRKIE